MSVDASQVAVVIPTRGDVSMKAILEALTHRDLSGAYIWANGMGGDADLGVYGRYAAIARVDSPVILTQDDDVILPPETIQGLLDAYEPGKVVCNVPDQFRHRYHDSGLVGFGAIFDRDLPARAFERIGLHDYCSPFPEDTDWTNLRFTTRGVTVEMPNAAFFHRTCDIVFTMLTPMIQIDLPYTELDYASNSDRMWKQPGHFEERERMRELCRKIRDGVTA